MVLASSAPQAGLVPEVFDWIIDRSAASLKVVAVVPVTVTAGRTINGPTPYSDVCVVQVVEAASSCRKDFTSVAPESLANRIGRTRGAERTAPPNVRTCGSAGCGAG